MDLRQRSRVGLVVGVVLALLLLAPLLGPGYVLIRDMNFVPRTPLGSQLLGVTGVPRNSPSELFVAVLSRALPTGWLQDLILLALVIGGAWGAARLAPTSSRVAAAAAATAYGWSAYLHERLLLGQWALLVGWAVLPWAVRAALEWRRGGTGWWAVSALAVSAAAGANALVLVGLAVVICGKPVKALVATAVFALPWAVPGLLQNQVAGDPRGVDAFASNSDMPLGVLGSLVTGGGVWARSAVPSGRSTGSWIALAVLLVAVAGLPLLVQRLGPRLPVAAALGLVIALLGAMPVTHRALRWAVVHVPAAGLLRDGQKWVAPLVLLTSAALACAVDRLLPRIHEVGARRIVAALLVLAPLAALPGAAWGEGGALKVSHYPAAWRQVTGQAHGAVVVLPWSLYRAFPWDHGITLLDPANKLLERPVVNDALPLPGGAVRGEDPVAARLAPTITAGGALVAALQREGISQVLVERTTAGYREALVDRQTAGLTLVTETPELALYDVPGKGRAQVTADVLPVVLGDLAAAALALLALDMGVRSRRQAGTERLSSRPNVPDRP